LAFTAKNPAGGSFVAQRNYTDSEDYYGYLPIGVTVTDVDGVPDQTWQGTIHIGEDNFGFNPTVTRLGPNTVILHQEFSYVVDGDYTVTLGARDGVGTTANASWGFTVDETFPQVSAWGPRTEMWDPQRPIVADLIDAQSGIAPESILMTVDGQLVTPSVVTVASGYRLTYVPSLPLAIGNHGVTVTAADRAGHLVTRSWIFSRAETNNAPRITSDSASSGFAVMSGGYWTYDDMGEPVSWVQPSVSRYIGLADDDAINRSSLIVRMSDSVNTTTRTVTPWTAYSAADTALTIGTAVANPADGQVFDSAITVADSLGVSRTYTSRFMAIAGFPVWSHPSPAQGVHQSSVQPTISVTFVDSSAGIDADSVTMRVDGIDLPVTLTPVAQGYSIAAKPLAELVDGPHEVRVSCTDNVGAPAEATWSFHVDLPAAPAFSSLAPSDGALTDYGSIIQAKVFDADGIAEGSQSLKLTLPSGQIVTAVPQLSWSDEWAGTEWEHSHGILTYALGPAFPEGGPISVELSVLDTLGTRAEVTWSISYVKDRPAVGSKQPAYGGSTGSTTPVISARVTDSSGVSSDTILFYVDNVLVPHVATSIDGGYLVTHEGTSFTPRTTHNVRVMAEDVHGFESSYSADTEKTNDWNFYVGVEPQASNITPAAGSVLTTDTPLIAVDFDEPDGLGPTTVVMTVDGKPVTPSVAMSLSDTHAEIRFKQRLTSGSHHVDVSIRSSKQLTKVASWDFEVAGFVDMPYVDEANDACKGCHRGPTYTDREMYNAFSYKDLPSSGGFDDVHNTTLGDSYHQDNRCFLCHEQGGLTVAGLGHCDACHRYGSAGNTKASWPAPAYVRPVDGDHGGTFSYSYKDRSDASKYAVNAPREALDCTYCHQVVNPLSPRVGPHDIPADHRVAFGGQGCDACHDAVLTREHAKQSARDAGGNALTCATCHSASDPDSMKAQVYRANLRSTEVAFTNKRWESTSFAPDSGRITSARLRLTVKVRSVVKVEALSNGVWTSRYSAPLYYPPTDISKVDTVLTFNPPAEAVRFVLEPPSLPEYIFTASMKLDEIETDDQTTCFDCHEGHAHPASQFIASDDRTACAKCHSAELVVEHAKSTSSSAAAGCQACHADGGPRSSFTAWDKNCQTGACHGGASAADPHGFAVAPVNYATACRKCHDESLAGTHPYHNRDASCGASCHPGWGASSTSGVPRYIDTFGVFAFSASQETSVAALHVIHSKATWPAGVDTSVSKCGSCHAVAACVACHEGSVSATHSGHASTMTSATPWVGPTSRGVDDGDQTADSHVASESVTCGGPLCHSTSQVADTSARFLEERSHAASPANRYLANTVTTTGTWRVQTSQSYTAGQQKQSNVTGSTLSVQFTGEQIAVRADNDPYRGIAEVFIDGVSQGTVDLYSDITRNQVEVYRSRALAPGTHTLTVKVKGTKSQYARATNVTVDRFDVYEKPLGGVAPACASCH